MKVLILSTGNNSRSQIAQGFLQFSDKNLTVCSAGIKATGELHEEAVKTMSIAGIDISSHTSDPVEKYLDEDWDFVITLSEDVKQNFPVFNGTVKKQLHFECDDPSQAKGTSEFIESEFERVRDEIRRKFYRFYMDEILEQPTCPCGANYFCRCE